MSGIDRNDNWVWEWVAWGNITIQHISCNLHMQQPSPSLACSQLQATNTVESMVKCTLMFIAIV